jgi:hypothetical protein
VLRLLHFFLPVIMHMMLRPLPEKKRKENDHSA